MEDRNVKWRVGVVVVATFVVAALLIAASTSFDLPFGVGQYQVQIFVNRAPGVGRNTPVRRDGVLVGRVERTEAVDGGRMIYARIHQNETLLDSDDCVIRPSSLFGDAVIDFNQSGRAGSVATPGQTLRGAALPDPLETVTNLDVGPAIESLTEAGGAVAELATRINRILGEEADGQRLGVLLDKGITAMDDFSATMQQMSDASAAINAIVGEPQSQEDLKRALAEVPELVAELRSVAQGAGTTLQNLDSAIVSAEQNLRNLEGLTEPLGDRGPELAQSAISALENLDVAMADISRFAKSLSTSQGTLGKLVNDPELYNNINTTVSNANLVVAKVYRLLEKISPQIRAIVQDVRTATDKVGREPGRVIGGAVGEGSIIK